MKKAKIMSRIWLALAIFAGLSVLLGTPALAALALAGKYIPMVFMMPVVGHGFLGLGFYIRAFYRSRLYGKLSDYIELCGARDPEVLSESVGLIPSAVAEAIAAAEKKGYL